VLLVAAERIGVLELQVERVRAAEVPRALVVVEDVLAVEVVPRRLDVSGRPAAG
jgi:hypothetical protein